jgi:hypothetical protein
MAVEEEIYQVRNQSNQDPLNFSDQAEQSYRGIETHSGNR